VVAGKRLATGMGFLDAAEGEGVFYRAHLVFRVNNALCGATVCTGGRKLAHWQDPQFDSSACLAASGATTVWRWVSGAMKDLIELAFGDCGFAEVVANGTKNFVEGFVGEEILLDK
jgi:hypothetical protein